MITHFQIGVVILDQRNLIVAAHHVLVRLVQVLQEAVIKLLVIFLLRLCIRFLNEILYVCHFGRVVCSDVYGFFGLEAPASRPFLIAGHHGPLLIQILCYRVCLLTSLV